MIRMETSWNLSRFDRIEHWVTSQSGLAGSVPVYMSDDLRDSGAMVVDEQVELRRLSLDPPIGFCGVVKSVEHVRPGWRA